MNFNSLRKEINSNNASVKELINDIFAKIDNKDPEINSYICITRDNAIAQAENIDKRIQNKEKLPPLAGMPIAIKDNSTMLIRNISNLTSHQTIFHQSMDMSSSNLVL